MKREELKALNLEDSAIDAIMALHGKDIEAHKVSLTTAQMEAETLKTQLADANKQIENFKGMKPEELQKAADEYKAKYEQAQSEAAKQLAQVKFDHALETALAAAKAKNPKAVTALLSTDALRNQNGEFVPELLDKQLAEVRKQNDYLFESDKPTPKIVTGGGQSVTPDKGTFAGAIQERLNSKG